MHELDEEYLGFKWKSKYYVFKVLSFGLSTAGYIFSKVMREVVKFWRSTGHKIVMYLDDGMGGAATLHEAELYWCAGSSAVDALSQMWTDHLNWVVPPPKLIPSVFTGIGLRDSIKRNAEKHGVEPGSYMADLCPYLSSWILSSKSNNTNKSYFNAFKRWENFIKVQGHSALPASPMHVALYLTHLLQNGSSQHPVNVAVYAIKWAHECAGLPDPTKNSYVSSLQEAARRKASRAVQKKEPITKDVLIELCDKFIDENYLLIVRNLTMILFCFAGFLRFDEAISLTFNDVIVHDEYLVLCIKKSKTDQYRQVSEVLVAKGSTSACPVNMYKKYLELLGIHSLRAGGATVAANSNVDERCLKKHGRWRSDSAKDGYIVDSLEKRLMVSRSLEL
ncbi:uncharacterized protein LOC134273549 [Saccostrea cucullata]|uniref:uncharacterized protein LOC134273549 n=1 Tax=Saccostrea cuccullata TaxID=36930 RepID=UPI002ED6150D